MNTRMMFAWVAADGAGEEGISRAENAEGAKKGN